MNEKLNYGLPKSMRRVQHNNYLELRRYWFSFRSLGVLAFACGWLSFQYYNQESFATSLADFPWLPYVSTTIGGIAFYYGLALVINHTKVNIYTTRIDIMHGPLPLLLKKTVVKNDIKQIYVNKHNRRSQQTTIITYELHMLDQSQRQITLIKDIEHKVDAKYFEQEIEGYMGIRNEAVSGEVSN